MFARMSALRLNWVCVVCMFEFLCVCVCVLQKFHLETRMKEGIIWYFFCCGGVEHAVFAILARAFPARVRQPSLVSRLFALMLLQVPYAFSSLFRPCPLFSCKMYVLRIYLFLIWISFCCLAFKLCWKRYAFAFNFICRVINVQACVSWCLWVCVLVQHLLHLCQCSWHTYAWMCLWLVAGGEKR